LTPDPYSHGQIRRGEIRKFRNIHRKSWRWSKAQDLHLHESSEQKIMQAAPWFLYSIS